MAEAETAVEQYLRREGEKRGTRVFLSHRAPAARSCPDGSGAESRFCGKVAPLRLMSMTLHCQVFVTFVTSCAEIREQLGYTDSLSSCRLTSAQQKQSDTAATEETTFFIKK